MADDYIILGSDGVTAHTMKAKEVSSKKYPGKILYDEVGTPLTVLDDAADAGGSIPVGGVARAGLASETLVAAADRLRHKLGRDGALFTRNVPLEDIVSGVQSNTDGTSTQVIPTGGAGIKQYLTHVILTNMHASQTVYVEMKSGTTVKANIPCPPGGANIHFDPPLPPNAADEAWNFDPSVATTTIYCTAIGFKSKV